MAATKQAKFLSLDRLGYKWRGQRYVRVSTIKAKKSTGSALVDWAARAVHEEVKRLVQLRLAGGMGETELYVALMADQVGQAHDQRRDEAADFGTVFHELVERLAAGRQDALHAAEKAVEGLPEDQRDRLWADAEAFLDWHDRARPEWLMNEFHVGHHNHGYMGTCDAIARIEGEDVLLDLKTSKNVYSEYALQLAAYRYAEFVADAETGDETQMPQVSSTAVLHVRDGRCRLFGVPAGEREWEAFEACLALYRFDRAVPKEFVERVPEASLFQGAFA